jgi:hypothetical protein
MIQFKKELLTCKIMVPADMLSTAGCSVSVAQAVVSSFQNKEINK